MLSPRRLASLALAALVGTACTGAGKPMPTEPSRAAADQPRAPEAPQPAPGTGPLLWRIQSPEGVVSFVLGTIHVGVAAAELSPAVWNALERSEVFVMETDLSAARSPAGDGPTVREALARESWTRLQELVGEARAAELANLDTSAGWAAVLQALYPAHESMDFALARSAADRGMALRYLEDWRWQLELGRRYFDLGELEALLDPASDARRELGDLVEAYRHGDLDTIAALALQPEQVASDPQRFEDLFFARNRRWAHAVGPWLRSKRCFIAVGAGHLVGDRGLLTLLRNAGFSMRRFTPESP